MGNFSDRGVKQSIDWKLVISYLLLILIGWINIYASIHSEGPASIFDFNFRCGKQFVWILTALVLAAVILFLVNPQFWESASLPMYLFVLVLLVVVIFVSKDVKGSHSWFEFGPVKFQPAEISKIAVIVITAHIICRMDRRKLRTFRGLIMVMLPSLAQAVAIYVITKNLSSAIIVVAIAAGMVFVASRGYKWFVLGAAGIGAAAYAIVTWIIQNGGNGNFRGRRILAWRDPAAYADSIGFQTLQALYGIGSGGIFGKGLGESMQKLGFIPEAQNDMIFSIICEELGLFGAISIIVLFMILTWRFMVIAMNARDLYSSLLVVGVMTHIAVQVILNIAVVTNTIPNTGISLPFISFGGSSVLFLLIEVGVVLRVMRDIRQES